MSSPSTPSDPQPPITNMPPPTWSQHGYGGGSFRPYPTPSPSPSPIPQTPTSAMQFPRQLPNGMAAIQMAAFTRLQQQSDVNRYNAYSRAVGGGGMVQGVPQNILVGEAQRRAGGATPVLSQSAGQQQTPMYAAANNNVSIAHSGLGVFQIPSNGNAQVRPYDHALAQRLAYQGHRFVTTSPMLPPTQLQQSVWCQQFATHQPISGPQVVSVQRPLPRQPTFTVPRQQQNVVVQASALPAWRTSALSNVAHPQQSARIQVTIDLTSLDDEPVATEVKAPTPKPKAKPSSPPAPVANAAAQRNVFDRVLGKQKHSWMNTPLIPSVKASPAPTRTRSAGPENNNSKRKRQASCTEGGPSPKRPKSSKRAEPKAVSPKKRGPKKLRETSPELVPLAPATLVEEEEEEEKEEEEGIEGLEAAIMASFEVDSEDSGSESEAE